jgi:MFS family permease
LNKTNLQVSANFFSGRPKALALYISLVSFLSYASVYAYRKPFTVAEFEGIELGNISYQTLLIISQVIGYMLSKFYGIRFIAALRRKGRWKTMFTLVGIAWLSLLIFAVAPPWMGLLCFLVNGFMLGFLWGIVFSYVEGRRITDFTGSVMAVSFIFAGGFTRSVAKWLMVDFGVTEKWMPFCTGAIFALPLALFIYLLEKIPPPDEADEASRTPRVPMLQQDRRSFMQQFGTGIFLVTITYVFLTVMRDIRDNYMANMWRELGYGSNYSIFTRTETITSVIILLMMGSLVLIRKNIQAFRIVHLVIFAGFLMAGISSLMFSLGRMDGALWMQLTGLGLYMAYIPFNCIFFERMIASFRIAANVGFLIYITDAFGYLGSVVVMLLKETIRMEINWSSFYAWGVVGFSVVGLLGIMASLRWFSWKYKSMKLP